MSGPASSDDRFARQRHMSGWRQDALAEATVIICGVGALGNEVAKNLGLAGVGRLVLCDPDSVERTNLSRTVLFREQDIGRPKVEAAAEAIAQLAPQTVVEVRAHTLSAGVGLAELRDSSAVIGCLDSRRARLELLGRCALADAVLVDAGTGPWSAEVRLRTEPEAACYGCTLTARERAVSDLPTAYTDLYPDGDLAASIALTALAGAWVGVTTLRLLFGETPPYRLLRIEGLSGTTYSVDLTRDPHCPHHRPLGPTNLRVPVPNSGTVGNLLEHLPPGHSADAWTAFPVAAECRRCGTRTGYTQPPAVRQGGRCVECGAPIRPAYSYHLSDAPLSDCLSDLGVAPREILPLRGPGGITGLVELSSLIELSTQP